ncbi:MAG: MipA/OmpV family protein [Burkholderiaceae bacterium]
MTPIFTAATLSKVAIAALGLFSISALAQSVDKKKDSPWDVSIGAAAVSTPEYEGGKKSVTGLAPDLNVSYRTQSFGTFGVGAKSRGISWTIVENDDYSFGIAIGASSGRVDNKDGTLFKPGSKRLRGMGEIKSSTDYGVFGHVTLGLPFSVQIMRNTGDGKVNSRDFSIDGHGGTTANLSVALPIPITPAVELSISPNLVWADKKYTQTYFGVTAAQAARSGFKAFKAEGGLKSVGLDMSVGYKIDKHWSASAGLSYSQLRGDAAKSPIVQEKGQASAFVGASYGF